MFTVFITIKVTITCILEPTLDVIQCECQRRIFLLWTDVTERTRADFVLDVCCLLRQPSGCAIDTVCLFVNGIN